MQHRVGDQRDGAVVVVHRGEVGDQQHHQLRQAQLVRRDLGQRLDPAHHVVAEVADEAAGQRRQSGSRGPGPPARRAASSSSGSPPFGRPGGTSPSTGPAAGDGQGRDRVHAHERPAGERGSRLGRLQQEGAGPAAGQLAVHPDRGLGVGEQGAGDRHQPVRSPASSASSARSIIAARSPGQRHAGVEAAAGAGVAGRPDLVHPDQQRVAVAVQ